MDEYADIYYVDNQRNATSRDHRPLPTVFAPRTSAPPPTVPTRTVYVQPSPVSYAQPAYAPAYAPPPSPLGALFGNMTAGQVIALAAEALAAFRSLPAAPVTTNDVATDVANGITYDTALAQYAKTDEQIRTIGHLVGRLVR